MFFNSLLKLHQTRNLDRPTHLDLDWEYFIVVLEKIGELLWPTPQPSQRMGTNALFVTLHLDEKEHGSWAFANTCTICNA